MSITDDKSNIVKDKAAKHQDFLKNSTAKKVNNIGNQDSIKKMRETLKNKSSSLDNSYDSPVPSVNKPKPKTLRI